MKTAKKRIKKITKTLAGKTQHQDCRKKMVIKKVRQKEFKEIRLVSNSREHPQHCGRNGELPKS